MYYNNKRLALSIFWIIAGIILLSLSYTDILKDSTFAGIGSGLFGIGLIQLICNIKYRKDKEYQEKVDIQTTDERNQYIRQKAWAISGYLFLIIAAIASIIALVMGQMLISQVLLISIAGITGIYTITYIIVSKKC